MIKHYLILLLVTTTLTIHTLYSMRKIKQELHILQLNSYFNRRYFSWLLKHHRLCHLQELIPALTLVSIFFNNRWLSLALMAIFYFKIWLAAPQMAAKKPLVITSRVMRLIAVQLTVLFIGYLFLCSWLFTGDNLTANLALLLLVLFNFLQPLFTIAANWLLLPLEHGIQRHYVKHAQQYLQTLDHLKIIGVTGSFGKTTTKYIIAKLLGRHFTTLKTPGSYNTLMGVTKTIRTELKPTHQVFVVEMSAKQPGDIQEICDLVHPQYGIITAIGEQHLETFKSLQNIKNTKNELFRALPSWGTAFCNLDDPLCRELAKLCKCKVVTYSLLDKSADYYAEQITVNEKGSQFSVYQQSGANSAMFETCLLGRHNISNILGAVAVAAELGVTLQSMAITIKQLEPIPHRLELKKIHNLLLIDDAFNANPLGSQMALEVLQQFTTKRKIIITPGMIELGAKEDHYNREFGAKIAKVCDYVILVGERQTLAIQLALKEQHYAKDQLFIAKDFNEARAHLNQLLRTNDIVLLENDLPDTYNES